MPGWNEGQMVCSVLSTTQVKHLSSVCSDSESVVMGPWQNTAPVVGAFLPGSVHGLHGDVKALCTSHIGSESCTSTNLMVVCVGGVGAHDTITTPITGIDIGSSKLHTLGGWASLSHTWVFGLMAFELFFAESVIHHHWYLPTMCMMCMKEILWGTHCPCTSITPSSTCWLARYASSVANLKSQSPSAFYSTSILVIHVGQQMQHILVFEKLQAALASKQLVHKLWIAVVPSPS